MRLAALILAAAWELSDDSKGVKVYRRQVDGSPFFAVKGTGLVDAPVRTVALVLLDDARAPEWVDSLAEARVVHVISPAEYIEYNHASMPPLVTDREFVTDVSMEIEAPARRVIIRSVPSEYAVPETGKVRGLLNAIYDMQATLDGKTLLTVEVESDPRGWLPAWVVNFFQKGWATQTIEGIRMQTAKKDLRDPPEFHEFLQRISF